ncbi:hypothetical protein O6H91_02G029800 [Diphasiastrum complanatum]|uniref:Uncharacterized protein n=1 Tax=Diphasiastrum complanatum TaxID=34168 RepID=A0ACC2EDZ5_DIPCM|nr:hypothetical protein O6H91_02G029800 [Diphasiastrum complanatum]
MLLHAVMEETSDESSRFDSPGRRVRFAQELAPGNPKSPRHYFCTDEEDEALSQDLRRSIHILDATPQALLSARMSDAESVASFRCRSLAAVPFEWEEEPGISKFPRQPDQFTPSALNLPPSRQMAPPSPHCSRSAASSRKIKQYMFARFPPSSKQADRPSDASCAHSGCEECEIKRKTSSPSSHSLRPPRKNCSATRAAASTPSTLANCLLNLTSINESSSLNGDGSISHPARAILQQNGFRKTHETHLLDGSSRPSLAQDLHCGYVDRKSELQHTVAARSGDDAHVRQTSSSNTYEQKLHFPNLLGHYVALEESLSSDSRSTNSSSSYGSLSRSSEIYYSDNSCDFSSLQRTQESQPSYFSCSPHAGSSSPVVSKPYMLRRSRASSDLQTQSCESSPSSAISSAAQNFPASPWCSREKRVPVAGRSSLLRNIFPACFSILKVLGE